MVRVFVPFGLILGTGVRTGTVKTLVADWIA